MGTSTVLSLLFFLCPVRYLGDGGTDWREILLDGTVSPFGGCTPRNPKIPNFGPKCGITANISKTVSRSVTCQLELKINSTAAY